MKEIQGKIEEAIAQYKKAISRNPKYVSAHYNLASALYAQDKLTEAQSEYTETIRLDPKYVQAYTGLGNALDDQGKPKSRDRSIQKSHQPRSKECLRIL
jgi:tetratricopeptide (TPR) repeat protein